MSLSVHLITASLLALLLVGEAGCPAPICQSKETQFELTISLPPSVPLTEGNQVLVQVEVNGLHREKVYQAAPELATLQDGVTSLVVILAPAVQETTTAKVTVSVLQQRLVLASRYQSYLLEPNACNFFTMALTAGPGGDAREEWSAPDGTASDGSSRDGAPTDNTPPTPGSVTELKWISSPAPGFSITFGPSTDDQSGIREVALSLNLGTTLGGSDLGTSLVASHLPAAGGTFIHAVPEDHRGKSFSFRLRAQNNAGTWSPLGPEQSAWARPKGVFTIPANKSATYQRSTSPGWRTDTDDLVSGCFCPDPNNHQTGIWLYGTAIADACKGYPPDEVRVYLHRKESLGYTGYNRIAPHGHLKLPTGAPVWNPAEELQGPYLVGDNAAKDFLIDTSWYPGIASGAIHGVLTVTTTPDTKSGYRRLYGKSSLSTSGQLTLTFK